MLSGLGIKVNGKERKIDPSLWILRVGCSGRKKRQKKKKKKKGVEGVEKC